MGCCQSAQPARPPPAKPPARRAPADASTHNSGAAVPVDPPNGRCTDSVKSPHHATEPATPTRKLPAADHATDNGADTVESQHNGSYDATDRDYRLALKENFPVFFNNHDIGEQISAGMGSAVFQITQTGSYVSQGDMNDSLRLHVSSTVNVSPSNQNGASIAAGGLVVTTHVTSPLIKPQGDPGFEQSPTQQLQPLPQERSRFGGSSSPATPPAAAAVPVHEASINQDLNNTRSDFGTLIKTVSRDDMQGKIRRGNGPLCCKITAAAASEEDTKQHWKEVVAYKALGQGLGDDHILQVHEHFMNNKFAVVVSEICQGGPLKVGAFRWPEQLVADVALQLLGVLEDMHRAGYCHLDIKPSHILIEQPQSLDMSAVHVRLAGFGCCTRFVRHLATLGEIPESPLYIAPEIWKIVMGVAGKERYDERCDLWSLGVVLYQMLSGQHPFIEEGPNQSFSEDDYVRLFEALYPEATDESPIVKFPSPQFDGVSNEAKHFLLELLAVEYRSRANAAQALNHPFIRKYNKSLEYLGGVTRNRLLFHYEHEREDVDVSALPQYMTMEPEIDFANAVSPELTQGTLGRLIEEVESNVSSVPASPFDTPSRGPCFDTAHPAPVPSRDRRMSNASVTNTPNIITSRGSFNRPRRPSWQAEAMSANDSNLGGIGNIGRQGSGALVVELSIVSEASAQQFSIQETIGRIKSPKRAFQASPAGRHTRAHHEFPKERAPVLSPPQMDDLPNEAALLDDGFSLSLPAKARKVAQPATTSPLSDGGADSGSEQFLMAAAPDLSVGTTPLPFVQPPPLLRRKQPGGSPSNSPTRSTGSASSAESADKAKQPALSV